ncbi:hypothetical protein CBR_g86503, partial [Chara braunii]
HNRSVRTLCEIAFGTVIGMYRIFTSETDVT